MSNWLTLIYREDATYNVSRTMCVNVDCRMWTLALLFPMRWYDRAICDKQQPRQLSYLVHLAWYCVTMRSGYSNEGSWREWESYRTLSTSCLSTFRAHIALDEFVELWHTQPKWMHSDANDRKQQQHASRYYKALWVLKSLLIYKFPLVFF